MKKISALIGGLLLAAGIASPALAAPHLAPHAWEYPTGSFRKLVLT